MTILTSSIEFVLFSIFSANHKMHKEIETYQRSEWKCVWRSSSYRKHCRPWQAEEVSRWCQCWKLVEETAYTKEVLYLKLNHEWINLQTYTKQADEEKRSKDIIENQVNKDIKLYNPKKWLTISYKSVNWQKNRT